MAASVKIQKYKNPTGGGQAAAAPGGVSPRLDTPPIYDQNPEPAPPLGNLRGCVTRYPSGLIEVTVYPRPTGEPRPKSSPRCPQNGPMREDHVKRARSNVRRRLMALDARYLLTLTTRANVTDYSESQKQVQSFWRKLKKHYPGIAYCGTPERQKRGAWHWHFGIAVRLDVRLVRAVWVSCCHDGNIDLQHRSALHIARYVAKYVGKHIGEESLSGKTYMVSRNIPSPETQEIDCDDPCEAFSHLPESWSGEFLHLPAGRGYWAASWR